VLSFSVVEAFEKEHGGLKSGTRQQETPNTNSTNPNSALDSSKNENGSSQVEEQEFLVWWDGDQDPTNPQNWPSSAKWSNIAVLSSITFLTLVLSHAI